MHRVWQSRVLSAVRRFFASETGSRFRHDAYFEVVENGSAGLGKSLLLFAGSKRYMFNCSEGLARALQAGGAVRNLDGFDNVFFTMATWQNISGLPEMMYQAKRGVPREITIHGPPGVKRVLNFAKCFAEEKNADRVEIVERAATEGVFVDGDLRVEPIVLRRSPREALEFSSSTTRLGRKHDDSSVAYLCELTKLSIVFLVVECPTLAHVQSLTSSFDRLKARASVVVHLSPGDVLKTKEYRAWVDAVSGPETVHVLVNELCPSLLTSEVIARKQLALNAVCAELFPPLALPLRTDVSRESTTKFFSKGRCVLAEPLMRISLLGDSVRRVVKMLEPTREREAPVSKQFPEFVFLGTSSSHPSKLRNVSSILLNLSPSSSMLLDCGLNTYGQLLAFYGVDGARDVLGRLRCVFVSHQHADHHLGLITLLMARERVTDRELFLIAGPNIFHLHNLCAQVVGTQPAVTRVLTAPATVQLEAEKLKAALGVQEMRLVRVIHPEIAHALVLITSAGEKLVYSGDTRPCAALIEAGRGADVLIHEASMSDELAEMAVASRHSTIGEAIRVGREMEAKFTLLTHFGGRLRGRFPLAATRTDVDERVGVAFDFLRVNLRQMPMLGRLTPELRAAFDGDRRVRRVGERKSMKSL